MSWISVKDRLPESRVQVLAFTKNIAHAVLRYQFNKWLDGDDRDGYTVTHWMPLPDGPNQE